MRNQLSNITDRTQCTRCRKRKIKCTGDVGDGSGCAACKAQGGDSMPCTFNRVSVSIQETSSSID